MASGLKISRCFLFFLLVFPTFSAFPQAGAFLDSLPLLEALNSFREERGVPSLYLEEAAVSGARIFAEELARRQVLSHTDEKGGLVLDRYHEEGGTCLRAGEILAAVDSFSEFIPAWNNSEPHRKLILGPHWRRFGAARMALGGGRELAVVVFTDSRWEEDAVTLQRENLLFRGRFFGDIDADIPLLQMGGLSVPPRVIKKGPASSLIEFSLPKSTLKTALLSVKVPSGRRVTDVLRRPDTKPRID